MKKQKLLYDAISSNDIENIKLLLKSNQIDPSKDNSFAITSACNNNFCDIVELLLKDKRTSLNTQNNCLISAVEEGLYDVVKLLLQETKINPCVLKNYAIRISNKNKNHRMTELLWNDQRVKDGLKENALYYYEFLNNKFLRNKIRKF
jgi:ankyrin repeat protein